MYNLNADEYELDELEDLYGSGCVTPDMLTEYRRAKWQNRANEIKEKYAEVNESAKSFARKNKLCALAGTGRGRRRIRKKSYVKPASAGVTHLLLVTKRMELRSMVNA